MDLSCTLVKSSERLSMWATVSDALTAGVNHEMCSMMYGPLDCSLVWRAVCPTGHRSGLSWNINQLVAVIIAAFDGPKFNESNLAAQGQKTTPRRHCDPDPKKRGQAEVAGH